MEKVGFLIRCEDGSGYFDCFRNCVMFLIYDYYGVVVVFLGRVFGSQQFKYMNSFEILFFYKSKLFYNFYKVCFYIRKQERVVLFEGFVDVILVVSLGVKESIVIMGMFLIDDYVKILRRNVEEIIFCYDFDKVGYEVILKVLDFL